MHWKMRTSPLLSMMSQWYVLSLSLSLSYITSPGIGFMFQCTWTPLHLRHHNGFFYPHFEAMCGSPLEGVWENPKGNCSLCSNCSKYSISNGFNYSHPFHRFSVPFRNECQVDTSLLTLLPALFQMSFMPIWIGSLHGAQGNQAHGLKLLRSLVMQQCTLFMLSPWFPMFN